MKKTINLAPTVKQLDNLWRTAVLLRDGGLCVYSKEVLGYEVDTILQGHHVLEKATHRLRWDLDNGITLTKGVHFGVAHSKQGPIKRQQFLSWALDRLKKAKRDKLLLLSRIKNSGGVDKFGVKIYLEKKIKDFNQPPPTE